MGKLSAMKTFVVQNDLGQLMNSTQGDNAIFGAAKCQLVHPGAKSMGHARCRGLGPEKHWLQKKLSSVVGCSASRNLLT